MMIDDDIDDPDLEAAEYVLGTLDGSEREAFAARLQTDGVRRSSVRQWEQRFAGLAARIRPIAPPAHVWTAIEQALLAPSQTQRRFVVRGGDGASGSTAPLAASRDRWRAAAVSFAALAAAFLVFILVDRSGRTIGANPPGETYIAAINPGGDRPALLVRVDLATRRVYVVPVDTRAPSDRSLELWYIGDGKRPRAVGLVSKGPATLPMPMDAELAGSSFAVSVEPPGGSTTGGPTGPVIYSGKLVKE